MEILFDLDDDAATRALGAALSGLLKTGDVIALHGDLGVGKTTLTRGLVQAYETPAFPLWHFDLYRLDRPEDVNELGWDDTQDGVAVIEWPARAGRYLPATRLDLTLEMLGEQRRARLEPVGEDWQKRLDGFRFSSP